MRPPFAMRPAFISHTREGDIKYQAAEGMTQSLIDVHHRGRLLIAQAGIEQLRKSGFYSCGKLRHKPQCAFADTLLAVRE